MRDMKRGVKHIACRLLMVVCGLMVMACSSEMVDMESPAGGNASADYVTAFGMLDSELMVIVADNGTTLHIGEIGAQTSAEEVAEHDGRVLFNYTILGNSYSGGFDIRLNRFYPLEIRDMRIFDSADTEYQSVGKVTDEWKGENFISLLEAPAMPYELSVGGGYININVCYTSVVEPSEGRPDVNLYYDVVSSTDDTAVLQLVGEDDKALYGENAKTRFLWFSFRIVDEVAAHIEQANIYAFYWCWWLDEGNPKAGVKEYTSVMNMGSYGAQADKIVKMVPLE